MRYLPFSSRLRAAPIILAILSTSCSPTAPTPPESTIVNMQVFYDRALSYAQVGSVYQFAAYALRSDGSYVDLTSTVAWRSSDSQVLRARSILGAFEAISPGQATVTAHYETWDAGLPVPVVRVERLPYPRLSVSGGDPHRVGATTSIHVSVVRAPYVYEPVSNLVTWTSATPSVVRVSGTSVTGVQVGTTVLSTSYNGMSIESGVSVHPRW
jgi:hypothetical protein